MNAIALAATRVAAGTGQIVWIEGEAGMGKTTVLRAALRTLPADFAVRRGEADEEGRDRSYDLVDRLGRRAAVSPLGAGVELLESWAALRRPVAVAIEDLHWADEESQRSLLAAGRRLANAPVLLLVTARPGGVAEGWDRLRLDTDLAHWLVLRPLEAGAVAEIAARAGVPLTRLAARRLTRHTAGHPIYVQTLLRELPPERLQTTERDLPAPRSLALATVAHLDDLPPPARALSAALAVLNGPIPLAVAGAVAAVDAATEALEPLVASDFVRWDALEVGQPIVFSHPLYRRAVYGDLAPVLRQRLHLRAAAVLGGTAALAHRAAAADGPDDALADELYSAARDDVAAGRHAAAARHLQLSADMTADAGRAEARLLGAALLLQELQHIPELQALRGRIEACAPSPMRAFVLGLLASAEGDGVSHERLLTEAANWGPLDPDDADPEMQRKAVAGALAELGNYYAITIRPEPAASAGWRALEMGGAPDVVGNAACAVVLAEALSAGPTAAVALLGRWLPHRLEDIPAGAVNLLIIRGMLHSWGAQPQAAETDLRAAIRLARTAGPGTLLLRAHIHLAQALEELGSWDEALVHAHVAVSVVDDVVASWNIAQAYASTASLLASRGEWAEADRQVARARSAAIERGSVEETFFARVAAAVVARARGDSAGVVEHLGGLVGLPGTPTPPLAGSLAIVREAGIVLRWWGWLVAALADAGRLDASREQLDAFTTVATRRALAYGGLLAALEGRLAAAHGELSTAVGQYRRALSDFTRNDPLLEQALVHHDFGRLLSRCGQQRKASEHLGRAHDLLSGLGAEPYRQRVEADLDAAGAVRPPKSSPLDLTAREHDVATLAARGLTKAEMAAELYISANTVDYHLRQIYAKLGVSSRRALRQLVDAGTTTRGRG
jgi:DNA-binding CsgD family transcriptional regulator